MCPIAIRCLIGSAATLGRFLPLPRAEATSYNVSAFSQQVLVLFSRLFSPVLSISYSNPVFITRAPHV